MKSAVERNEHLQARNEPRERFRGRTRSDPEVRTLKPILTTTKRGDHREPPRERRIDADRVDNNVEAAAVRQRQREANCVHNPLSFRSRVKCKSPSGNRSRTLLGIPFSCSLGDRPCRSAERRAAASTARKARTGTIQFAGRICRKR